MTYIAGFTIEGLAGRSGVLTESLRPDINIFFGANGSGKTSLLKLLHSALSGKTAILRGVPVNAAEVRIAGGRDEIIRTLVRKENEQQSVLLEQEGVYFRENSKARASWEWQTTPTDAAPRNGWLHSYLSTTRLYGLGGDQAAARYFRNELDESELDSRFSALLERLWSRYNADISRSVRNAQERGLTALVAEIIAPGTTPLPPVEPNFETAHELVSSFLSRQPGRRVPIGPIEEFKDRYETDRQFRNVVSHLSTVELRIREADAPRGKLQDLLNHLFTNKTVSVGDENIVVKAGDTSIPIASLSSGEKHALRLFVEAISNHRNSIIIDEPELSLHVDWQRELVVSMRQLKPACQLILATHSPEIMVGVDDSNIFRL
jgi:predicted ATPase